MKLAIAILASCCAFAADPPAGTAYRATDDKLFVFGTDNDFQAAYDSSDNRIELRDASGNIMVRVVDNGSTGIIGVTRFDVVNGSYASQITSGATANRAVTLPDAAGEISLLGQTVESAEITNSTIVNADISASAAIVPTKFSAGTNGQVVVTSSGASGWGTVPSAGITDGTIVNADISASAAIGLGKLDTTGATNGQIVTYNGTTVVWDDATTGDLGGPGPVSDNGIPRMDGSSGYTIQGYATGQTPFFDDAGNLFLQGNHYVSAGNINLTVANDEREIKFYAAAVPEETWTAPAETDLRWTLRADNQAESGTWAGTEFGLSATGNTGGGEYYVWNTSRDQTLPFYINKPLDVSGVIYAGSGSVQITDSTGYVQLASIAQTSATTGQVLGWNGSAWAPSSSGTGNVINLGAGTDNHLVRFNGTATPGITIQDGQIVEDDSGNVDIAGTLTVGSSDTVITTTAGLLRGEAFDESAALSGDHTLSANGWKPGANGIIGEGATADAYELYFAFADPASSDKTITVPAVTGTLVTTGDTATVTDTMAANDLTINSSALISSTAAGTHSFGSNTGATNTYLRVNAAANKEVGIEFAAAGSAEWYLYTPASSSDFRIGTASNTDAFVFTSTGTLVFEGATADAFETTLQFTDPAASDKTITVPNTTGTLVTTGDTASVTGTMITNDTVALTTDTSGNYVASITNGNGITGGNGGSEGAALTVAADFDSLALSNTTTGNVGTGEDTLYTFNIPAGTLATNGDTIHFRAGFLIGANAAETKQFKIYFGGSGGTKIYDSTAVDAAFLGSFYVEGFVVRDSATTQSAYVWTTNNTVGYSSTNITSPTQTLSGTIEFLVTGTATTTNACQIKLIQLEWMRGS